MGKTISKLLAYSGLALTLVPSLLVFSEKITWGLHARLMLAGMILWFVFSTWSYRIRRI
jgi:hypothetical protein